MPFVTSRQVQDLRNAQPPAVVLDVRIPEEFDFAHLAGAMNACVFLVSFVEDVRRLVPDPATPVVVYGAGGGSLESTDASRRLSEAGYLNVFDFVGGITEWKADGLPTLGQGTPTSMPIANGRVPLDLDQTRLEWTGRNLLNKHWGTVEPKSGHLEFSEGWLVGGEMVIEMASIQCLDIADPQANAALLAHLRSADFFDVGRHPEARLAIREASPIPNGRPGVPNLRLVCALTLRGITRDLPVVAVAGRTPDGRMAAQAVLAFDRTDWGSSYGSGRFFRQLGRHLVNDLVELQVRIVTAAPSVP